MPFNNFPLLQFADDNLDWMISKLKELDARVTALEEAHTEEVSEDGV